MPVYAHSTTGESRLPIANLDFRRLTATNGRSNEIPTDATIPTVRRGSDPVATQLVTARTSDASSSSNKRRDWAFLVVASREVATLGSLRG